MRRPPQQVLPGFRLTMGLTLVYLSLVVLLPLSILAVKTAMLPGGTWWETISSPRVLAAFRVSFLSAFLAACINVVFGVILAWVLVRYTFPFKRLVDALVDLPFALPTAVAGISLTAIYDTNGWMGRYFDAVGIHITYTMFGIILALTFIGFPFVVRSVQPVLEEISGDIEEAAASLGATRRQVIGRVLFPYLRPAIFSGFVMAFARALGEYGSVIFIAGNMPMKTEIVPLLIVIKLEQFDYAGANVIASAMLFVSFCLFFLINLWQSRWRGA